MRTQVYLDTSALVKRYVDEAGSREVAELLEEAEYQATSIVVEAELPAALSRAVRTGAVTRRGGDLAVKAWARDREDLVWIRLTQPMMRHAGTLAWQEGLRGYDAVHLAAALWWQANLGQELLLATYDRELWRSAGQHGLGVFPEREP